jgi:hypothetical protein
MVLKCWQQLVAPGPWCGSALCNFVRVGIASSLQCTQAVVGSLMLCNRPNARATAAAAGAAALTHGDRLLLLIPHVLMGHAACAIAR